MTSRAIPARVVAAGPVWRIRDRATFAELRRHGHRARSGPLSLTWLSDPAGTSPPRVAYAIGRPVGPAVVRNRLRRRLRAAVAQLVQDMAPGAYLIAASPQSARASFQELRSSLAVVLTAATTMGGNRSSASAGRARPAVAEPGRP